MVKLAAVAALTVACLAPAAAATAAIVIIPLPLPFGISAPVNATIEVLFNEFVSGGVPVL